LFFSEFLMFCRASKLDLGEAVSAESIAEIIAQVIGKACDRIDTPPVTVSSRLFGTHFRSPD
jgi:hypothetical protein